MSLTIHSKFGKWRHHGRALLGPIHPQINHGRWIIECPCCPSAALARCGSLLGDDGQDRFLCSECNNAAAGGRYFEVAWPARKTTIRALKLLAKRPNENRNWLPGEPVEMLEAENVEHGLAA